MLCSKSPVKVSFIKTKIIIINKLKLKNMVTVAMATGLTTYIPMLIADSLEQGLQVCSLLKKISPSYIYTVVSNVDKSLELEHVREYTWDEPLKN